MNPENLKKLLELKELLHKSGKHQKWFDFKGGEFQPDVLKQNQVLLKKLRSLLQQHLEKDIAERDRLQEMLLRLKHGGGI